MLGPALLPGGLPPAPLEDWLRDYYFSAAVDISSSGVEPYSMVELRDLGVVSEADISQVVFRDSPSLGGQPLRQAIADRWCSGDAGRVLVANGSNEAIFLVLVGLLSPGDEVVVHDPCYHSLLSIAEAVGCKVRRWPLRPERGFIPDLDEFEGFVSSRTRLVLANFPHNPTGVTLDLDAYERFLEVVSSVGAWLVWDAAFAELTHDGEVLPDPSATYERAVSFGTLSKAYGLPGLRAGWCLGPPAVLDSAVQVKDYMSLAVSPLVEMVATRAVEAAGRLLQPRLEQARRNRELIDEWVYAHSNHIEYVRPTAGVVSFPGIRTITDVDSLCHRLMADHGVLVVPGSCFGHPGHIRIGFGGPTAELEIGLARLSDVLDAMDRAGAKI
jgi:capreomycidine synthase